MNKEFVPYEQALALKELGFDEQCLALYDLDGKITIEFVNWKNAKNRKSNYLIAAPLYQQAFRWFREKYNLDGSLSVDVWNTRKVSWRITGGIEGKIFVNNENELYDWESDEFNNYEEAELECLKKLIEIAQKR